MSLFDDWDDPHSEGAKPFARDPNPFEDEERRYPQEYFLQNWTMKNWSHLTSRTTSTPSSH